MLGTRYLVHYHQPQNQEWKKHERIEAPAEPVELGTHSMDANLTVAAASAISQSQVQNETAMVVAQKTLQAQKQQGEAAVSLVKQVEQLSTQLAQGRIDVRL